MIYFLLASGLVTAVLAYRWRGRRSLRAEQHLATVFIAAVALLALIRWSDW